MEFEAGAGQPAGADPEASPDAGDDPGRAVSHRPASLDEVVGQARTVNALRVAAKSAMKRGAAMGHTLLLGNPGTGKTTLAQALATEIGTRALVTSATIIKEPGVLLRLLTSVRDRDVVFVDEIHALPTRAAESLYEALEDRRLSMTVTDGRRTRTVTLRLPPFTLVGATTEIGALPEPMINRFAISEHLDGCSIEDLMEIVTRAAVRDGMSLAPAAASFLAAAANGVPRAVLMDWSRVRDEAVAVDCTVADLPLVERTFAAMGVDQRGVRPMEQRALDALRRNQQRGPVGVARWAAVSGIAPATLRKLCEPTLLRLGLIAVTPRGRVAIGS